MSRGQFIHQKKKKRRHHRSSVFLNAGPLGGGGVSYIFRDEFTTALTAGNIDGTKSSDGKATRSVVDTGSTLSISGGKFVCAGGTNAWEQTGIYYTPGITRAAGVAVIQKMNWTSLGLIMFSFLISESHDYAPYNNIGFQMYAYLKARYTGSNNSPDIVTLSTSTDYILYNILRSAGRFLVGKIGLDYKLLWADTEDSHATVYVGMTAFETNADFTADYVQLAQLPAPFDTDYGLATDRLAGARSAGDTFTHEADFVGEMTVDTLPSVSSIVVRFRQASIGNYWYITIDSSGNISLIERVSDSPTTRGSAFSSIANGQRLVVITEGETIKVYANNALVITYESAANFKTAIAGELNFLGTGGAVSDIVTYPRTLSGTAASVLTRYSK